MRSRTDFGEVTERGVRLPPVICPTGSLREIVSSPFCKNIPIFRRSKSALYLSPSRSDRGALAIVTNAGRDAVDADGATDEAH
jgi:hypothetical protein